MSGESSKIELEAVDEVEDRLYERGRPAASFIVLLSAGVIDLALYEKFPRADEEGRIAGMGERMKALEGVKGERAVPSATMEASLVASFFAAS